ncbi:MAG: cell division regulator GpsB [Firmicutes bacterium]|nr:cell division regulator GpsB [Bacillota bacterium]
MYQNRITLTPQDILNKEFKIDTRGFRLKEVDQFLDVIIGDYEEFYKILKENEKEKEELLEEIMNLKQEIRNLKTNIEIAKSGSSERREVTNLDIMKRLSQLEKIVYGKEEEQQ